MRRFLKQINFRFPAVVAIFFAKSAVGQETTNDLQPEMALGIKIVFRPIEYGATGLYVTDPNSIGLQPVLRHDVPLRLAKGHSLNLAVQSGFLFSKAKVFDTTYFDPGTNVYVHEHSRNPVYWPVSFGIYNRSWFSIGTEIIYWKGLGTRDLWGIKFISLGYNGRQFRMNASGEWYAQGKKSHNNGLLFSVDFFLKLINSHYRKQD